MGLFDKLSNLIFEEETTDAAAKKTKTAKKGSWTDIFYEDAQEDSSDNTGKKKRSFSDLFFEEETEPDDELKSTFVVGDEKTSVLDDIQSKIERRESELRNLAEFFRTVNPKEFPESAAEYQSYLSLLSQLTEVKKLAETSSNATLSSIKKPQLEMKFNKFEQDYQAKINAIRSLCYLSEISTLNAEMEKIYSSEFTPKTEERILQTEGYISLISQKSNSFDKKYAPKLYKELIEAEYRLTTLKLMNEISEGKDPRRNPFASFSDKKKKTFETYMSKDIRDTNTKYNAIADGREKYTKYGLISSSYFDRLDEEAAIISERINKYTIDDFLVSELFENGEGFSTLKRFLRLKLNLNYIDTKTVEADTRFLDENYERVVKNSSKKAAQKPRNEVKPSVRKSGRRYPDFDEDA